jgi:hypothetical protein
MENMMNRQKSHLKNLILMTISVLSLSQATLGWATSSSDTEFEVSLYTGIPSLAHLGESYRTLTENSKFPYTTVDILSDEELLKAGIVYGISFDTIGAKVFFKRSGSALISLQPPFKGLIKSKQIQIFTQTPPANMGWEKFILRELGEPDAKRSAGKIGGDIFFYSWGDIQFNSIGIKQVMLYRDKSVAEYRQNLKFRDFSLFK